MSGFWSYADTAGAAGAAVLLLLRGVALTGRTGQVEAESRG